MFEMIESVEDDEFDVQSGLQAGWAITFCVLYIIVMLISFTLYFITVRAIALEIRAHNTTYLLIMVLFLAAIIEFGVIVGGKSYSYQLIIVYFTISAEFMARFGHFSYTETNCKLVTFIIYGNRILQISTAMTMLYYNTLASYLKTTKFQLICKRYLPVIVLCLLVLEVIMVLPVSLAMRSSIAEQWCEYTDNSVEYRDRVGWLYNVLFPYFLPFVSAVGPFIYLSIRLKEGHIIEPHRSQVLVSLAVVGGFFVFYFLYYILMIARQVQHLVETSSAMHRIIGEFIVNIILKILNKSSSLGVSVMFITRPMFTLIGHIWHISVPLSVLLLDKDLRQQWPGSWMLRGRLGQDEDDNSIVLSDVGSSRGNNNHEGKTEVSNTFSVMMLENREFHNNYSVNVH